MPYLQNQDTLLGAVWTAYAQLWDAEAQHMFASSVKAVFEQRDTACEDVQTLQKEVAGLQHANILLQTKYAAQTGTV
jgi:hypothetical protein